MERINSLFLLFFSWWYGYLPRRLYLASKAVIIMIVDLFSVKLIFSTLFAPWKRDVISYEGLSLQEKFSVFILNISSRFIGFVIKIFVLLTFIIFFLAAILISAGLFSFWIVFPLAIVVLLIFGVTNLFS